MNTSTTTQHYWAEVFADNPDGINIEASTIIASSYWGIDTGKLAKLAKAGAGQFDRAYLKQHSDNWPSPIIRGLYQAKDTGIFEAYSTSADGRRNGQTWTLKAKTLKAALRELCLSVPEIAAKEKHNAAAWKAESLRRQAAQLEMEYA